MRAHGLARPSAPKMIYCGLHELYTRRSAIVPVVAHAWMASRIIIATFRRRQAFRRYTGCSGATAV